ncbi:MAG: protein kinase domain-containing protein [Planctomycetota bacterium]
MDEQSIFLQALEQPEGDARDQWLAEACGNDSALKGRIAALLKRDAEKGSFLESPVSPLDATVLHDLRNGIGRVVENSKGPLGGTAIEGLLNSIGGEFDIPRVSLREEDGSDPILRPGSNEIRSSPVANRYQLLGEIARGGMGAILKGRDNDLGRDLAIKVLLDSHKDKPEVIQRFIEEAQIGGQLQHPGIAPIYDLGRFADNRPFFAMKLVKGQTLSKLLSDRHATSDERSRFLGIFENVCQTVGYAHSRGVIHRDLKPANIMVGAFGEVQVMDWGLAKVLADGGVNDERRAHSKHNGHSVIETIRTGVGSDSLESVGTAGSHTQVGSVMGTPAYMPPEQALGEVHSMDERADVFALGAILCEILTGKPPYVADDGTRLFRMAMRGKLDDCFARLASCDADEELIALTKDCLELDPIDRPRDAGVLANRVRGYLESVEARLREAETARAAQTARAEAEALRLAQQQQATRKLQRMLAGLAAVALFALGASVVAGLFWQRATVARNQAQANETLARNNAERADKNAQEAEQQAALAIEQKQLAEQNLIKTQNAERETAVARDIADQKAELASRNLYFAEMRLAQKSFYDYRSVQRMRDLLGNWVPKSGETDRRGWEWFYLNSLAYRNVRTLTGKESNLQSRALAWHPRSKRLADGVITGQIRIWDLESETPTLVLDTPNSSYSFWARHWIDWNVEGDKLAAGFQDKTVRVWNTVTGDELLVLEGLTSSVMCVSFNRDGSRIAACGTDGRICFWDVANGRLILSLSHPSGVNTGALSHDGQWYATGHGSGEMFISDATTGERVSGLKVQPGWFSGLEWSPDDRRIAITGTEGLDQVTFRVWDVATQKPVFEPQRHNHAITALAWEPDGRRIATGTMAEEIRIWDADSGTELNSLRGHTESITSLAWGSGDSLASVATDGEIKIWTIVQRQPVTKLPNNAPLCSVCWSPDGMLLASADDQGRVFLRDAATGLERCSLQAHTRSNLARTGFLEFQVALAWSPDSTRLVSASLDGVLKIWEASTGREVLAVANDLNRVWCIDWGKDGKSIAVGSQDGCIRIVDVSQPEARPRVISAHDAGTFGVTAVAWSPDGDRLVSCGNDGKVKVWDPKQGVQLSSMEGHGAWIFDVAWSPDGKRLASSGADRNVILWDVEAGKKRMALRSGQEFVMAVAWNPEGNRLASTQLSGDVQIWDSNSGEETCSLQIPYARFLDISWSSDGARIAAASSVGDLCIWDATQGFERDTTPRAFPYIARAFATGTVNGEDRIRYAKTYLLEGKRDAARTAVGNDLRNLILFAQLDDELGNAAEAKKTRRQARILAEKELLDHPFNRGPADSLLDLLLREVEDRGYAMEQDRTLRQIRKIKDRWGAIAIAYQLLGEELSFARVLRDHPKARLSLADLDASLENWDRAIEEYSRWITPETNDADLLNKRGSAYFAIGQWELARQDWDSAVEIRPNPELTESIYEQFRRSERWQDALPFGRKLIDINPGAEPELVWLRISPVAALAGEESYRNFCQDMVPQFRNTTDPLVADRLIKACLLRPGSIDPKSLPIAVIEEAFANNKYQDWAKPWAWGSRALWAYRNGDPASAVTFVANSEALQPPQQVRELNLAILALAERDLNHDDASRLAVEELSQLISQARESSDILGHDSLIAEVLLHEAKAKLRNP